MNWQLVRNVPPFRERIILLYEKRVGTLFFGRLKAGTDGQLMLELSTGIIDGGLGRAPIKYEWSEFIKQHPNMWWAPFIKP